MRRKKRWRNIRTKRRTRRRWTFRKMRKEKEEENGG